MKTNPIHLFKVDNVAGCARPRSINHIHFLKDHGISAVLSLTAIPLTSDWIKDFVVLHVPVRDFSAPTQKQLRLCVDFLNNCVKENIKPVVHCTMGYGRTGTVIAAYLIASGLSANKAIKKVRRQRPGAIETPEQEDCLFLFEAESGK